MNGIFSIFSPHKGPSDEDGTSASPALRQSPERSILSPRPRSPLKSARTALSFATGTATPLKKTVSFEFAEEPQGLFTETMQDTMDGEIQVKTMGDVTIQNLLNYEDETSANDGGAIVVGGKEDMATDASDSQKGKGVSNGTMDVDDDKINNSISYTNNHDNGSGSSSSNNKDNDNDNGNGSSSKTDDISKSNPVTSDTPREADDGDEFSFESFIDHRWVGHTLQIRVKWAQGDYTWEPELSLYEDAPAALVAYWKTVPGGRPPHPKDKELYEIYTVRDHSKDRKNLLVEWVGYGPKDSTWEPRSVVEEAAPDLAAAYWKTVRTNTPNEGEKRGRGRPRGSGRGARGRGRGRGRPRGRRGV